MLLSLWLIPSASVGRDSAAQDRKAVIILAIEQHATHDC